MLCLERWNDRISPDACPRDTSVPDDRTPSVPQLHHQPLGMPPGAGGVSEAQERAGRHRWHDPFFETSDAAARAREGHARAKQDDPTLGGFTFIERRGPAGLVADEAARRHYFGQDLA